LAWGSFPPNRRFHHFPPAAARKWEVWAVSVGCLPEWAWSALARSNNASSVKTMLGLRMQESIGHTTTHCCLLKKPTHSVQASWSIMYADLPLRMPPFGHTGSQAPQLIQPSFIMNGIDKSPASRGVPSDSLQRGSLTLPVDQFEPSPPKDASLRQCQHLKYIAKLDL